MPDNGPAWGPMFTLRLSISYCVPSTPLLSSSLRRGRANCSDSLDSSSARAWREVLVRSAGNFVRRQGLPMPPPAPFAGPRNVRREQRRCCPPAPGRSVGGRAADGRAGRQTDGRTGHARTRPQLRRHSTGEKRKNRLRHESLVGSSVSLRGRTEETASQRRSSRKIRREQQIWPRGTAARLPGLVISTSLKGLTQFQLETNVELYWPARSRFLPLLLSYLAQPSMLPL